MRPIDADLLLKFPFLQGRFDRKNGNPVYISAWETFKELVESQPILRIDGLTEYESKPHDNSRWIIHLEGEYSTVCECPDCGGWQNFWYDDLTKYCSRCGSCMEKEDGKE